MNFDNLAADLYALAPARFVAERTSAEKQARSDGDRELATRIHQLAKPTTVGWLANQLVRAHPEEIGPLLELGAGLREATSNLSRDKLQELMRLQHQVISGLVKQARTIAKEAGQRLSEETVRGLEETLRAALADESLGEQLRGGRLTGVLEHGGFPGTTGEAAPSRAPRSAATSVAKNSKADQRLAKAEQAVADASAAAESAAEAEAKAQELLVRASTATHELNARMQELKAGLERAVEEHQEAQEAEREARRGAERSAHATESAQRQLDGALATREELAR